MLSMPTPRNVSVPWPEGEQVFLAGYDPNKVCLEGLHRAELLYTAGKIPASEIRAAAERLTQEYWGELLAYQDFLDYMDAMYERSPQTISLG